MTTETLWLLAPEIVLIATAALIYVAGAFVDAVSSWRWLAGAGVVVAAVLLAVRGGEDPSVAGPVAADALAHFARGLALAVGGLFVLLASRPLRQPGTPEYLGSLLLTVAGLMLAAAADDLVFLFVGLELVSIPTYILLAVGRRDIEGREAAAKYFFLSVFASAMLLYGLAFLYGAFGTTDFSAMLESLRSDPVFLDGQFGMLVRVGVVLLFAGLGFKIAAVPFHFYAPDVYQGTSHANAAVLSVLPKAAGMLVLVRLLVLTLPDTSVLSYSWRIALVLAVLTMTFGNVVALWQENLRRLMAYSSIAHAGYMLVGLAVGLATPSGVVSRWDGVAALLFYLVVYSLATIGTFAALSFIARRRRQIDAVDELAGLASTRPKVAAMIALFMFSLAGIPPLAGFWGKLVIFAGALGVQPAVLGVRPWFLALAVIGMVNAAVAAAYYLRVVGVMYFRTPLAPVGAKGGAGAGAAAALCGLLTVVIGLYPGPLMRVADQASRRQAEVRQPQRGQPVKSLGRLSVNGLPENRGASSFSSRAKATESAEVAAQHSAALDRPE